MFHLAQHKFAQNDVQYFGRQLLGFVAPSVVGRAVAFDYQTVELQIHGLLRQRRYEFAFAADVAATDFANGASYFLFDTALPDVNGGFGTTLRFYGFDLSVNFVYQIGGKVYDGDYASAMSSPVGNSGIGDAFHKDILKSWTPQNPNNEIPRFQYNTQYTGSPSDRFLTDASYLSLQNINFGYTLPSKWMSKIGVSKLRIYLSCENVWLWSQRKGLDPRQSYNGGASNEYYSPIRTISGGISLTF